MINIFTDGACSGNGTPTSKAGIGVVIEWNNTLPDIVSKFYGIGKSNNEAEYGALLEALQQIKDKNIKSCVIKSDSNLMVNQVNGKFRCKDAKLILLKDKAESRMRWLKDRGFQISLEYIPREFNLADNPAKKGCFLSE